MALRRPPQQRLLLLVSSIHAGLIRPWQPFDGIFNFAPRGSIPTRDWVHFLILTPFLMG